MTKKIQAILWPNLLWVLIAIIGWYYVDVITQLKANDAVLRHDINEHRAATQETLKDIRADVDALKVEVYKKIARN